MINEKLRLWTQLENFIILLLSNIWQELAEGFHNFRELDESKDKQADIEAVRELLTDNSGKDKESTC